MASREWFKHDAWFLADDKIRDLGHGFGPGGPLVASALLQLAKRQKSGGIVTVKWSYLAEHAFVKRIASVKQIVAECDRLSFIRIHDQDNRSVTLEPLKWQQAQGSGLGAERTAAWRARQNVTDDLSQNGHGKRHGVTDDLSPRDTPSRAVATEEELEVEAKASTYVEPIDRELCRHLARNVRAVNPNAKIKSPDKWANDMRLLRVNDKNTPDEIRARIDWAFQGDFWGGVIQSAGGLRKHWPKLCAQMNVKSRPHAVEDSAAFLARREGTA